MRPRCGMRWTGSLIGTRGCGRVCAVEGEPVQLFRRVDDSQLPLIETRPAGARRRSLGAGAAGQRGGAERRLI